MLFLKLSRPNLISNKESVTDSIKRPAFTGLFYLLLSSHKKMIPLRVI